MRHRFTREIEQALDWSGPSMLGKEFTRGSIIDTDLPARLLTPHKLLDLIMRRSLSAPQFRCFRAGEELHPSRFLSDSVSRRGQSIRIPDMRRLGHLLDHGCTLVLDEVNLFDPTMEVACRALQWWSHELVQVNTYLTTQDAAGFSLHWDDHDVLILQLAGEKSWEVRGASRVAPMYRDAEPNNDAPDEVIWSGTMHPGDVMHIPRGYWHQATRTDRGDGYSLHATFGFVKRAGVNWIAWLADRAREHELFRHDLERWSTAASVEAQQEALAQSAVQLLKDHPPTEFLTAREQQRPTPRHIPYLPIFGNLEQVVCVTEFPPHLEEGEGTITVLGAGKRITFAAQAAPALHLLLSGAPVRVGDVAEATGVDAEQLADVLVKEELCAQVTPELSLGYTGLVTSEASSKTP
ncbi:cupin [Nocardiopsis alba]|uniref:Cupin n=1 Tax=Nocardiopsis alba TaxID=53437 RepID=A0A7K2IXZ1_9ACTN|nr:cupin domain-containing protein [Nocardiopsis alba]MYR34832.1 cupin [Nocardiopsis alba]